MEDTNEGYFSVVSDHGNDFWIRGDWFNPKGRDHHTGAVYQNGHWLVEAARLVKDVDPNEGQVEINVRQAVFYPEKPGMNYITVRGFKMMNAATPWAPPTAEQIGLIGHHIVRNNHIYRTNRGIWLDWMTQGTRVTGNLLHDNGPREDLFVEVNHGPFLVDNNVFLSGIGLLEACGGGAYAHNLFGGQIRLRAELTRETPFHKPHSTEVLGLSKVVGDDERFHNNLFIGYDGLSVYGEKDVNLQAVGNVYLAGAQPSAHDREAMVDADFYPNIMLEEKPDGLWLEIPLDPALESSWKSSFVTTGSLGRVMISDAPYVKPDGTPYRLDTDYFGNKRNTENPAPGPFRFSSEIGIRLKVWPKKQPKDDKQTN